MTGFLKKAGLGALAAATLVTATAPADAQRWGGYGGYHGYHRGGGIGPGGAAVLGGILGLGIGAAIASDHPRYYNAPGYYYGPRPNGYYGGYGGGYYGDGYYAPRCWTQWRWDPYYGGRVPVRVCE